MNGVWVVEWTEPGLRDCTAVFSTRQKAMAHIESEAARMDLPEFNYVSEDPNYFHYKEPSWGVYEYKDDSCGYCEIFYQWHPIE